MVVHTGLCLFSSIKIVLRSDAEKQKGWLPYLRRVFMLWLDEESVRDADDPAGAQQRKNWVLKYGLPNIFLAVLPDKYYAICGFVFVLTSLEFLLPIWRQTEVDKSLKPPKRWLQAISMGLVTLYATAPYLGLCTAGSFTMFSTSASEESWLSFNRRMLPQFRNSVAVEKRSQSILHYTIT